MSRRLSPGCTRHCLIFLSFFEPMHPELPVFSAQGHFICKCAARLKSHHQPGGLFSAAQPGSILTQKSPNQSLPPELALSNQWFLWCEYTANTWLNIILLSIEMYASIKSGDSVTGHYPSQKQNIQAPFVAAHGGEVFPFTQHTYSKI